MANLRADKVYGVDWRLPGGQRGPGRWCNTAAFAIPAPYVYGNTGRNIITAPETLSVDLSLMKNFTVWRENRLQFRAEAFNVPNHVNFGKPNNTAGANGFGVISSAGAGRQIQFALKYVF